MGGRGRRMKNGLLIFFAIFLLFAVSWHAQGDTPELVAAGFRDVQGATRMQMFWRIFGPAWTKEEIDYQFGELKKAHVGGVMAAFNYPVALDDPA